MPVNTNTPATAPVIDPAAARADAETHSFSKAAAESSIQMQQDIIDTNVNKVNNYKNQEENIQNQLSPPPTKSVPDGKGTKEVVDEKEVAKLEGQLNSTKTNREAAEKEVAEGVVQLAQASAEAKQAESAAATSNNQAENAQSQLDAAGIAQQQNQNNPTTTPGNSSGATPPAGTTNPNGSGSQPGSSGSGSGNGNGSAITPTSPSN